MTVPRNPIHAAEILNFDILNSPKESRTVANPYERLQLPTVITNTIINNSKAVQKILVGNILIMGIPIINSISANEKKEAILCYQQYSL